MGHTGQNGSYRTKRVIKDKTGHTGQNGSYRTKRVIKDKTGHTGQNGSYRTKRVIKDIQNTDACAVCVSPGDQWSGSRLDDHLIWATKRRT